MKRGWRICTSTPEKAAGNNGDLTGFAHGLNIKEKLIALEKRRIK